MKLKHLLSNLLFTTCTLSAGAQQVYTLDSLRALAIRNNKELQISKEQISAAREERKAAFTKYLPHINATGGYMHTGREISILSESNKSMLGNLGSLLGTLMGNTALVPPLNQVGEGIVDALNTDTRNVFAGAVTLTQPLFMGGKIRAYNRITHYAEELARSQNDGQLQETILKTDEAYWQIVSLGAKEKLAQSYLELLNKLDSDVEKMIAQGVATRADGLSIKVKVNEAEMALTKVNDGLMLSRMLLCQLCGISLSDSIRLADERNEIPDAPTTETIAPIELSSVYAERPEIRSLTLATEIYRQKVNAVRADFLPTLALTGGYLMSNPSFFNGFERRLKGTWSVGVMLNIPLWNWGEGLFKVRAARSAARIADYRLDDAKEKIELQVTQSRFRVHEAERKQQMTARNLEKAEENLRHATLGFEEGVIPASAVLEAHSAWLSARSERIDAAIDVRLTHLYLKKALGTVLP
jgi:outer membrane protein TolC